MILTKRSIPRAATAALVLGGCSSSDRIEDIAANYCGAFERCNPAEFDLEYASQAECRDVTQADLRETFDLYSAEYSRDCADSVLDYYGCIASAIADACDANIEAECDDAYYDMVEICGF